MEAGALITVLVVDSNPSSRENTLQLLQECSYQAVAVERGSQALRLLAESVASSGSPGVHVVLKDHDPPSSSAVRFLKHLREHPLPALRSLPVIVTSGQDSRDAVLKCLDSGAADYWVRPLRFNEVRVLWTRLWRQQEPAKPVDESTSGNSTEAAATLPGETEPSSKEGSAPDDARAITQVAVGGQEGSPSVADAGNGTCEAGSPAVDTRDALTTAQHVQGVPPLLPALHAQQQQVQVQQRSRHHHHSHQHTHRHHSAAAAEAGSEAPVQDRQADLGQHRALPVSPPAGAGSVFASLPPRPRQPSDKQQLAAAAADLHGASQASADGQFHGSNMGHGSNCGTTNGNGHGSHGTGGVTSRQQLQGFGPTPPLSLLHQQQLQSAMQPVRGGLPSGASCTLPVPAATAVLASAAAAGSGQPAPDPAQAWAAFAAAAATGGEGLSLPALAAPAQQQQEQRQLLLKQLKAEEEEEADLQRGANEVAEVAEALTSLRDGGSPRHSSGGSGFPIGGSAGAGLTPAGGRRTRSTAAAAAAVSRGDVSHMRDSMHSTPSMPSSYTAGASADTQCFHHPGAPAAQFPPLPLPPSLFMPPPPAPPAQQQQQQASLAGQSQQQQQASQAGQSQQQGSAPSVAAPLPSQQQQAQQQAQSMVPPFPSGMLPPYGSMPSFMTQPVGFGWPQAMQQQQQQQFAQQQQQQQQQFAQQQQQQQQQFTQQQHQQQFAQQQQQQQSMQGALAAAQAQHARQQNAQQHAKQQVAFKAGSATVSQLPQSGSGQDPGSPRTAAGDADGEAGADQMHASELAEHQRSLFAQQQGQQAQYAWMLQQYSMAAVSAAMAGQAPPLPPPPPPSMGTGFGAPMGWPQRTSLPWQQQLPAGLHFPMPPLGPAAATGAAAFQAHPSAQSGGLLQGSGAASQAMSLMQGGGGSQSLGLPPLPPLPLPVLQQQLNCEALTKKEVRLQAYAKYKAKRKKLHFGNKIRYQTRKKLADQRPRVKGQFVRMEAASNGTNTAATGGAGGSSREQLMEAEEQLLQQQQGVAAAAAGAPAAVHAAVAVPAGTSKRQEDGAVLQAGAEEEEEEYDCQEEDFGAEEDELSGEVLRPAFSPQPMELEARQALNLWARSQYPALLQKESESATMSFGGSAQHGGRFPLASQPTGGCGRVDGTPPTVWGLSTAGAQQFAEPQPLIGHKHRREDGVLAAAAAAVAAGASKRPGSGRNGSDSGSNSPGDQTPVPGLVEGGAAQQASQAKQQRTRKQ